MDTIKDIVKPETKEELVEVLKEDIDSIEDPILDEIEDVIEDDFEEEYMSFEPEVYSKIPEVLSTEDRSRLDELVGFAYINSKDKDIIREREKLIILQKSIELKRIAEDKYSYDSLDEGIKIQATIFYKDSL